VAHLTAALDAVEDEYPEDDERETSKSANDTDNGVFS
jgi:hypothetical protein